MRRSISLTFLVAIIAALAFGSLVTTNRSASAGQGKGGEVIAKPTPTPTQKKTTSTRPKTGSRAPRSNTGVDELAFWETIKNSTDPEDFNAYLTQFPKGKFVTLAKNRLKTLEAAKGSASPTSTNPTSANPSPTIPVPTNPGTTSPTSTNPGLTSPGPTNSSSSSMPRTRTNQTGIEFVLIPPGHFMMGSINGEENEKPIHKVTISQAFYMAKYEVTQAQWQSVMGSNPANFKDCGGNCPVESVSWNDAQNFINKLNESNDGFIYRLPTEAEWEYACRAGTTGDYAGNLSEMAWYSGNSGSKPVGSKRPNDWGLADMHGNVWEWCQDWYHHSYNGAPTDGSAWLSGGEQKYRVVRGGSWVDNDSNLRSASRSGNTPDYRIDSSGFRVVAVARTQ